jgi:hypothetical protein
MVKPPRSPLLGYNHNLTHLGRVFHIQTEDSGPVTPRLFTHLFHEGTILVSRKQEYDSTLPDDKVRGMMQEQHKTVMKDLMRARLDGVILPFFAARGDDLLPVQGAVPSAALSETPGPVMVLPEMGLPTPGDGRGSANAAELSAEAATTRGGGNPARVEGGNPGRSPPAGHRRSTTRPFEPTGQRGPTPTPVVVRPPDARRSPFVRNGTPAPSRMSSADGVVVQRNLVVGGAASSSRPARIRPPVPYIVTGGGRTERPRQSGQPDVAGDVGDVRDFSDVAAQQPTPQEAPPAAVVLTPSPLAPLAGSSTISSSDGPHRSTNALGFGLVEDKSLDEVILEYLSEDGDAG